jgi:hypothetical protein
MLPEKELVVLLSRTPLNEAERVRAISLISTSLNWGRFFEFAQIAQVEPVTMSNLLTMHDGVVPEAIRRDAEARRREVRAIALSRTLAMNELVSRFENEEIPVIVIKGPALGVTGYGDPTLRSFADIDLLIKREDLVRSRNLLLAAGYLRDYTPEAEAGLIENDHALEFSGHPTKVELHAALLSRYLRVQFHPTEIWKSPHRVTCAGKQIRVLPPEIQFLFLCAHGAKHEWVQLRWICDLAQLADRMTPAEWERLGELSSRLHAKRIVAVAGRLVSEVFGREFVPDADSRRLGSMEGRIDSILERIGVREYSKAHQLSWTTRLHPSLPALMFWIASRERFRDKVGCGAGLIFPRLVRSAVSRAART